ncbi:MAG: amino acid ABC transporter substrate-binding protein [Betaproteobacteria bacterium]
MKAASPVLLLLAALFVAPAAWAGKTLDTVRQRGEVACGVTPGLAGFSAPDNKGNWSGIDVDVCKAIAAAVLGDARKVRWVPLNSQQRFTAIQSGEVDILSRNTTWTLTRDASLGLHFTSIVFHDGQGFMVRRKSGITSARQLDNAVVCVQSGTTTEKNLADYLRAEKIHARPVVFEGYEASLKAFFAGRCQAYTTDASSLAAILQRETRNPADYRILPELISKEPLAPAVRRGDDEWFAIVKWVINALINAEELGVTQANVDAQKSGGDPVARRLLGNGDDTGKALTLDAGWAYRAIKAVGNYGEVFERNLGSGSPLKLPRGANNLWNRGGHIYAPPIR